MVKAAAKKELVGYSRTSFSMRLKSFCHLTLSSSNFVSKFLAVLSVSSDFFSSFLRTSASPVFSPNTFFSPLTFSSIRDNSS